MKIIEKDGKKFQITIQRVCKTCGRLELRCKCGSKQEIIEKIAEYQITEPSIKEINLKEVENIISDQKEVCHECNRLMERCNCEKIKRNEEVSKIMNMEEEDVNSKVDKESQEKKSEMEIALQKRNDAAIDNVKEIMDLKKSLSEEGKSQLDIKEEIKKLKKQQKSKIEEKKEIENPVKCVKCGNIYSDNLEHECK